jgi:hypothetical protein
LHDKVWSHLLSSPWPPAAVFLTERQGKSRVPDHLIRLRGAWELIEADAAAEVSGALPVRLSLPFSWPAVSSRRVRLVRKFGRPAHDPAYESLLLTLNCVPGLRGVWLNGLRLTVPDPNPGRLEIPIDRLPERNELVLDVEPPHPPGDSSPPPRWGEIALVIRREPSL